MFGQEQKIKIKYQTASGRNQTYAGFKSSASTGLISIR